MITRKFVKYGKCPIFYWIFKIRQENVNCWLDTTLFDVEIFEYFKTNFDVEDIYLTLKSKGVKFLDKKEEIFHIYAEEIDSVKDNTGAGDVFCLFFIWLH